MYEFVVKVETAPLFFHALNTSERHFQLLLPLIWLPPSKNRQLTQLLTCQKEENAFFTFLTYSLTEILSFYPCPAYTVHEAGPSFFLLPRGTSVHKKQANCLKEK